MAGAVRARRSFGERHPSKPEALHRALSPGPLSACVHTVAPTPSAQYSPRRLRTAAQRAGSCRCSPGSRPCPTQRLSLAPVSSRRGAGSALDPRFAEHLYSVRSHAAIGSQERHDEQVQRNHASSLRQLPAAFSDSTGIDTRTGDWDRFGGFGEPHKPIRKSGNVTGFGQRRHVG